MPTIEHFEIPADDVERARGFYKELFGWEIEKFSPDMDYWFVKTTDREGKPALCGGMMKRPMPQQQITNYVGVDDVDASAEKVKSLGGQIIVPKQPVPGMGWFVFCMDTENNVFAMWQGDKNAA